jgi:PAS domain S-box-containing protein
LDETLIRSTDQVRAENAALRQHLATLGDIALAGDLPLDDLLQKIVDTGRPLLNARYAALGVFDAHRRVTQFFTSGISLDERHQIGPLPVGEGLLGYILRERRIVRIPRIGEHPESVGFPPNHPPMSSFLGGPIARGGKVYGNLYLTDRIGADEFSVADEKLLSLLASQAAIALTQAELHAREQADLRQAQVERSSLESIFDSLTDGVYTTDLDDRIVRLNRRAMAWSGSTNREVIGKSATDVFRLVDDRGFDLPLPVDPALTAGEISLVLANGDRLPVELLVSIIRDNRGEAIGQVHVLRDLRPQREVEQLKANIISLVSHELRTPLSHIKGYASTLLQPDVNWDPETQHDFIASIERQADRLARLITDLLEISRLDAGGTARMELVPIAPASLIERGVRLASPNPTLVTHPLTIAVSEGAPLVLADPSHIERVLSNLIENAAKYSPDGSPIAIDVREGDNAVVFAVHDRGTGLTPEEKSHLFERFYRSPRVKHRTPGTGLGLAICHEIVKAHGGKIWAESVEGEGSVFRFTLPTSATGERIGP